MNEAIPEHGCGCGGSAPLERRGPTYVYAVGRIESRFPSPGVEKEFMHARGRAAERGGLNDLLVDHAILSDRENRYLAREMCYVLTIAGIDTYLLEPGDPLDFQSLIEAVRPAPPPKDLDVAIGVLGPVSAPSRYGGLSLPVVRFDKIYSFSSEAFLASIPHGGADPLRVQAAAEQIFPRLLKLPEDNAGAAPEHRAVNFLALRYAALYTTAAERFGQDFRLSSVEARPSPLSGARELVDVVFAFSHRGTDATEKLRARVDVTEQYPFLAAALSPFVDRY